MRGRGGERKKERERRGLHALARRDEIFYVERVHESDREVDSSCEIHTQPAVNDPRPVSRRMHVRPSWFVLGTLRNVLTRLHPRVRIDESNGDAGEKRRYLPDKIYHTNGNAYLSTRVNKARERESEGKKDSSERSVEGKIRMDSLRALFGITVYSRGQSSKPESRGGSITRWY